MPFVFRILKAGSFLTGTGQAAYTVGSGTTANSAIVSNLRFYGGGAGGSTVDVNVKTSAGGTSVRIAHFSVLSTGVTTFNTELTLAKDSVIELDVTTNSVECLICGVERV